MFLLIYICTHLMCFCSSLWIWALSFCFTLFFSCCLCVIFFFPLTLVLSYIIEGRVCYLTMCDRSYPKKLAFQYLEDLANEFERVNGNQIETAARPYAFIKFGRSCIVLFNFLYMINSHFHRIAGSDIYFTLLCW